MAADGKDLDTLLAEVSDLATQAATALGGEEAAPAEAQTATATAVAEPSPSPAASARKRAEDPRRILSLEVPVIVELARRTMPMADILNLSSGSIIEFEKAADGELDLMINNKCIGKGLAVKVGENFGLRIRAVGSVHDRIRALGK